jgi:hypothetical protein
MLNIFPVSTCHLSLIDFEIKGRKVLQFDEKKGNNSKMGNAIYFKIAGWADLDMLHIFAI